MSWVEANRYRLMSYEGDTFNTEPALGDPDEVGEMLEK
jgi:hypothetical protein